MASIKIAIGSVLVLGGALGLFGGCANSATSGSGPTDTQTSAAECTDGVSVACTCSSGASATRACSGGKLQACGPCPTVASCGNGVCDGNESCDTCEKDCGTCKLCSTAPSCKNVSKPATMNPKAALNVTLQELSKEQIRQRVAKQLEEGSPGARLVMAALDRQLAGESPFVTSLRSLITERPRVDTALRRQVGALGTRDAARYRAQMPEPMALAGLRTIASTPQIMSGDAGAGDGGAADGGDAGPVDCGPPSLRVRLGEIKVYEEDDDWANDIVYCTLSAEGKGGSEVRITPKTPNLDEGQTYRFANTEESVFWGMKAPRAPDGPLVLNYECFEQDDANSYQSLIRSIEVMVQENGGYTTDVGGYKIDVVIVVANVLQGILALDGDDHLFSASQTIQPEMQVQITKGATWEVRKKGSHLGSDWDWGLKIEAWGCAKYGGG